MIRKILDILGFIPKNGCKGIYFKKYNNIGKELNINLLENSNGEIDKVKSKINYKDLGITQLATRIKELKEQGYEFKTEWESSTNRFGEKTDYKRYYLADMISENMQHIRSY